MMNCLIVDDDPLSAFALRNIIQSGFPDWNILTTETMHEAIHCLAKQAFGIIVLNLDLEESSGLTLLAYLQKHAHMYPSPCIVVSSIGDPDKIEACKKLGARGYVQKKNACNSMFSIIREAMAANEKPSMRHAANVAETFSDPLRLTQRQRDIIDLLLNGYSNKMIAHALNLSYGTVKNYMFDLMRLTSVNSRLEMAMKLHRSGYTPRKIDQIEKRAAMDASVMMPVEHAQFGVYQDATTRL